VAINVFPTDHPSEHAAIRELADGVGARSVGCWVHLPICGDMRTMPGLGACSAATRIDIDRNGEIVGLS
jgi:formyltetrahydrofolate synthetase